MCYAVLASVSRCYPPRKGRLLTRYSPVRHWSIATSVRLECVMHAASVHPEPGSNSRYLLYYLAHGFPFRLITSSLSSLALSFLPIFLELCSLLKVLRDPFAHILPYMLVLLLLLFSFQGSTLPPHRAARLLYHFPLALSRPFRKFFWFFQIFCAHTGPEKFFPPPAPFLGDWAKNRRAGEVAWLFKILLVLRLCFHFLQQFFFVFE